MNYTFKVEQQLNRSLKSSIGKKFAFESLVEHNRSGGLDGHLNYNCSSKINLANWGELVVGTE